MKIHKYLIAKGNPTALVVDYPETAKAATARDLLLDVEQVGFISGLTGMPALDMMGHELCINATLAFARYLGEKEGFLGTSGLAEKVHFFNESNQATIEIPCRFRMSGNTILFDGIGYILCPESSCKQIHKDEIAALANQNQLPAFGCIVYDGNRITPFVYVKDTNSFVQETACGSGSLAYALFSGCTEVAQPSGGTILVSATDGQCTISAEVEAIA